MDEMEIKRFDRLVEAIRENGYGVDVTPYDSYINARIRNTNIATSICTHSNHLAVEISGKVVIDNYKYSDIWANCAVSLPIPNNDYQINFIIKQIEFWGSREGARIRKNRILNKYIYSYPPYIYGLK